jgi:hypothetical protein
MGWIECIATLQVIGEMTMNNWNGFTPNQFAEIDQLTALLSAEALGHAVDRKRVGQLLTRIRVYCPYILGSLALISERLEERVYN